MEIFLWLLVIMAVFVLLIAGFTKFYAAWMYKKIVAGPLEAANHILANHSVPPAWQLRGMVRYAAKRESENRPELALCMKKRYTKRLRRLIEKMEHSTLLEGEARTNSLQALREDLENWQEAASLDDIL